VRVCFVVITKNAGRALIEYAPDHDVILGRPPRWTDYQQRYVNRINPDLSAGEDLSLLRSLKSNAAIAHAGVKPYARSLHVDAKLRSALFANTADADRLCPKIYNGSDLGQKWRGLYILDLNGLEEKFIRENLPKLYQYLLQNVKPERSNERNPRLRHDYWRFEFIFPDYRYTSSDGSEFMFLPLGSNLFAAQMKLKNGRLKIAFVDAPDDKKLFILLPDLMSKGPYSR